MKLLVFLYCDSFCNCKMLCLAGSYDTNKTYVMFGMLLCLAATPVELGEFIDILKSLFNSV